MDFPKAHRKQIAYGKRDPTIETALACEVLFGVSPSVMFPQAYDAVEERVMRDVHRLDGTLSDTSAVDLRKRELLSSAFARAITRPNTSRGSYTTPRDTIPSTPLLADLPSCSSKVRTTRLIGG